MFQHQSLGSKVNIQVTKLVLLRQRPVSPLGRPSEHAGGVTGLEVSWLLRSASVDGCRSYLSSQALQMAAVCPGPGSGDVPWEEGRYWY